MEIQKFEFLMNRERFLDEIKKHFSEFFKGYHLVKKKKKKKKPQRTQALTITKANLSKCLPSKCILFIKLLQRIIFFREKEFTCIDILHQIQIHP